MKGDSKYIKRNTKYPNGGGYDPDDFADKFIEQLRLNKNNVSAACRTLEISYNTYRNHYNTNEDFRRRVDELGEELLDFVEGKMFQIIEKIDKGAPGLIMFYLKTKGKHRGYGDDNGDDDSTPSTINIKFN